MVMKKAYESPVMKTASASQYLMLQASLGKSETKVSNNDDVLSRRGSSFWDDDE